MGLRSFLYALARALGWYNAASRGPSALGKRFIRREVNKSVNRSLNKFLR